MADFFVDDYVPPDDEYVINIRTWEIKAVDSYYLYAIGLDDDWKTLSQLDKYELARVIKTAANS